MTTQQKFAAAVNVIRNLPKNGPFQPSTDMKLKFYAYFKQATEGPNTIPKPSIWDIQGRVKWSAWKELDAMSQDEAMEKYIEELKSIVETMSYNANVETFLSSLGAFYDCVPAADVDLVLGPVIEKVKSRVHSPLASRDSSPTRNSADDIKNLENMKKSENGKCSDIHSPASESDDDEFSDVIESLLRKEVELWRNQLRLEAHSPPFLKATAMQSVIVLEKNIQVRNTARREMELSMEEGDRDRGYPVEPSPESSPSAASYILDSPVTEIASQSLSVTINQLQQELTRVTERVNSLETAFVANSIRQMNERNVVGSGHYKFLDLPLSAWWIVILWPVCANLLLCFIHSQKRN